MRQKPQKPTATRARFPSGDRGPFCFFGSADLQGVLPAHLFKWYHVDGGFNMGKATIVSDPEVMMGKPVVARTRITVEYILEELAHGQPIDTLVDSHPTLTREGVLAALGYAAKVLRLDVVEPIEAP